MKLNDYETKHLKRLRTYLPECMVLLKKDGSFPLDGPCRIAALGNGVRRTIKGGTGSGEVNSRFFVTVEEGLEEAGFTITTKDWLDRYDEELSKAEKRYRKQLRTEARKAGENIVMYAMGQVMPEPEYEIPCAPDGDAAIYVLSRVSGEGSDRKPVPGDVLLTETEKRDILKLNREFARFILVLNTGGPVDLTPVSEVKNILLMSQLGVEGGRALADVLQGYAYPSGKLAATWTSWEDYCPDTVIGDAEEAVYREGVYVGYRYFDTAGIKPMFPFGFGLGYTSFEIRETSFSAEGTEIHMSAAVHNTGDRPGKETVQLYVSPPENRIKKPFQQLAAFAKTGELMPGQSEEVLLSFDMKDIASFMEEDSAYVLEQGKYVIRVGSSSAEAAAVAAAELDRDVTVHLVHPISSAVDFIEAEYRRACEPEETDTLPVISLHADRFETQITDYDIDELILPETMNLTDEELVYLSLGAFKEKGLGSFIGNSAFHVAGAAGETSSLLTDEGIGPIIMADGPAGLRLAREYYSDESGAHAVKTSSVPESMLRYLGKPLQIIISRLTGGKKLPKDSEIREQYCTAIPIGSAVAQSWNTQFAWLCGDIIGDEMERFGVQLWLAPALNIQRSILCGRNFEYYSEDPLISGRMAAAVTKGVQAHPGRGVTIKHLAANNQEYNRYYNNSRLSERCLREIYLRGFEICIREAAPAAVMTSYNLINGTHTSEHSGLIKGFLRAECGYEGLVISDWVISGLPSKGGRFRQARADLAAEAGGDVFMPGSAIDYKNVLKALKSGRLTRSQLEINAAHLIRMARRLDQNGYSTVKKP